jgi:sugar phosphate isomerase/epimerase
MPSHRAHRDWTRRDVLAAGLAVAGAVGTGRTLRSDDSAAQGDSSGPYSPFKMGIQSYSLRGYNENGRPSLGKALAVTKELGLHFWEAYPAHVPMGTDASARDKIKAEFAAAGVTLVGYGVVHLSGGPEDRPIFEFAKSLGLEYISADPDPGSFDALDKLVETFDIAIGIHNHGPGNRYAKIDTIHQAIKDHHPKIGCCIDTGHFLRSKEDPVHAVEVFGNRVFGVHLKDVKDATTFTVLGQGDLRTVDFLKALAQNKYRYCLAIEYEEKPEDPQEDIKSCLTAAAKVIAEVKKT